MTRRMRALALSLAGALLVSIAPVSATEPDFAWLATLWPQPVTGDQPAAIDPSGVGDAAAGIDPAGVAAAPAGGSIAGMLLAALGDAGATLGALADSMASRFAGVVSPALIAPCGTRTLDKGSDGRLTVLLLGSDYRKRPYIGERTDIIIVATLKSNGHVAMASIPRDTVYIPKAPSNGGGTSGANRVNTLYYHYRGFSLGSSRVSCKALKKLKADIATTLQTEIDAYAMVRMVGFARLVSRVGGINVDVPGPIIDTYYARHGLYFPDKDNYHLKGNAVCYKKPFKCRSALAFVRSRHGTQAGQANNDFKRAHRQHQFIMDAVRRVLSRGTGDHLRTLLRMIKGKVYTNLPKTMSGALSIYHMLEGAKLFYKDTVVFGPRKWAYSDGSTPLYAFRLRLGKVRAWINDHFES